MYPRLISHPKQLPTRRSILTATFLCIGPVRAQAQMSQRARQVRERRACEEDLPACRPEIRVQLEAERQRIRYGLSGLAILTALIGLVYWRHITLGKAKREEELEHLNQRLSDIGGKVDDNQAKSARDERSES